MIYFTDMTSHTCRLLGAIALASAAAPGPVVSIAPAYADDASYLAATSGLYHSVYDNGAMLHWGHGICDDLHGGRSFDQEVATAPPMMGSYMDVPGVIRAAQHELCPDTLH